MPVRLEASQGPVVGKTTNISLGGALVEVGARCIEVARIPERTTMDIIVDEDQLSFDILVAEEMGIQSLSSLCGSGVAKTTESYASF